MEEMTMVLNQLLQIKDQEILELKKSEAHYQNENEKLREALDTH